MSAQRIITCACCRKQGHSHARNLIHVCYQRHRHNGTLHRYPTRPASEQWQPTSTHGERMLARYQQLAAIRPPLSKARIAWELGVSERSVERYAAALRAQQARATDQNKPRTEAA